MYDATEAGRIEAPDEYDVSTGGLLQFTVYLNPGYMLTACQVSAVKNDGTSTIVYRSTDKETHNGGIGYIVTELEMQMMPEGTDTILIMVYTFYYPRLRIDDNEYYPYWIDENGNEKQVIPYIIDASGTQHGPGC